MPEKAKDAFILGADLDLPWACPKGAAKHNPPPNTSSPLASPSATSSSSSSKKRKSPADEDDDCVEGHTPASSSPESIASQVKRARLVFQSPGVSSSTPVTTSKRDSDHGSHFDSADDDDSASVTSHTSHRSYCSDHFAVQSVPLLSRIRSDSQHHGAFRSLGRANARCLETMLDLTRPRDDNWRDKRVWLTRMERKVRKGWWDM